LLSKPLRAISADEISRFAFKALTTWGTLQDYKYFLPRILELTFSGELFVDIEITVGKVSRGDFDSWPPEEQTAIREVLRAAWIERVETCDVRGADSILCAASGIYNDPEIAELLTIADALDPNFKSSYVLRRFDATQGKLVNAFWGSEGRSRRKIMAWLSKGEGPRPAREA
jgi:hypothetical protein